MSSSFLKIPVIIFKKKIEEDESQIFKKQNDTDGLKHKHGCMEKHHIVKGRSMKRGIVNSQYLPVGIPMKPFSNKSILCSVWRRRARFYASLPDYATNSS